MSKVYWNKKRTSSVVLDKIKEYTIIQSPITDKFELRGWYNQSNSFIFGEFETEKEAQAFLTCIHNILVT